MEELEDLLCRLFYEAEMVLVRPLTQGWSGSGVILVQPYFKDRGRGEDVIVKFGDMDKIKREHYNFQRYVKNLLSGARCTTVNDVRYTSHLGGIVYSLLGAGKDQLVDFAQFYQNTDDIAKIIDVLDHLFEDTCANWYINRSRIQPLALVTEYQRFFNYSRKKLERILAQRLPSTYIQEKVEFASLNSNRKFTNPLLARTDPSFTCYTYTCIMHGDLNQHNLFIDRAGFTWLIDFQATEPGHILRDLATLDSVIRFQLLRAWEARMEERLQMEEVLCSASHFSQLQRLTSEFAAGNLALEKAFATVVYLRTLAAKKVMQGRNDDLSEYYIALFYNALNTLKFPTLETVQHEHALLCASLLADRLSLC